MARSFVSASSQYYTCSLNNYLTVNVFPWSMFICFFTSDSSVMCAITLADGSGTSGEIGIRLNDAPSKPSARTGDASTNASAVSNVNYSTTQWNRVCAIFPDTASRSIKLNDDSVVTESTNVAGAGNIDTFSVGRRGLGAGNQRYVQGFLAYAALWNVALTNTEMDDLTSENKSPLFIRKRNLVGFWPLQGNCSLEKNVVHQYLPLTQSGLPQTEYSPRIKSPFKTYPYAKVAAAAVTGKPEFYYRMMRS